MQNIPYNIYIFIIFTYISSIIECIYLKYKVLKASINDFTTEEKKPYKDPYEQYEHGLDVPHVKSKVQLLYIKYILNYQDIMIF